jgi:hypothetical protein
MPKYKEIKINAGIRQEAIFGEFLKSIVNATNNTTEERQTSSTANKSGGE